MCSPSTRLRWTRRAKRRPKRTVNKDFLCNSAALLRSLACVKTRPWTGLRCHASATTLQPILFMCTVQVHSTHLPLFGVLSFTVASTTEVRPPRCRSRLRFQLRSYPCIALNLDSIELQLINDSVAIWATAHVKLVGRHARNLPRQPYYTMYTSRPPLIV